MILIKFCGQGFVSFTVLQLQTTYNEKCCSEVFFSFDFMIHCLQKRTTEIPFN